jgi:elongation factor 1 alpha-like protein
LILHSRVLTRGTSAEIEISLRAGTLSGPALSARPIPLEPFSVNKDMGRILVRRGGETISAGKSFTLVTVRVLNNLPGIVVDIIS